MYGTACVVTKAFVWSMVDDTASEQVSFHLHAYFISHHHRCCIFGVVHSVNESKELNKMNTSRALLTIQM